MKRSNAALLRGPCRHSTTVRRAGRARSAASWRSSRISPSSPIPRFCLGPRCVCSRLRREETARRTTHPPMAVLPDLLATPPDGLGRCRLPAGEAGLRRQLVPPGRSGRGRAEHCSPAATLATRPDRQACPDESRSEEPRGSCARRPHGRGAAAARARHGPLVTYSPKVFIPLTTLCRDVCGYCTFARPPRRGERAYMTEDEVLAIARAGAAAGCREALFTLGDKPELRYKVARDELARARLRDDARVPRALRAARARGDGPAAAPQPRRDDARRARRAAAGLRVDGDHARDDRRAARGAKGGPHWASPDKVPARRLETIRLAGELAIPFTSGILIGIGETREERIDALLALKALGEEHGHVQEVIVQNFRAKPGTRMADAPRAVARRPPLDDRGRADPARPRRGTCRRRRTSPTTTSRACSTRASTTGAASRP